MCFDRKQYTVKSIFHVGLTTVFLMVFIELQLQPTRVVLTRHLQDISQYNFQTPDGSPTPAVKIRKNAIQIAVAMGITTRTRNRLKANLTDEYSAQNIPDLDLFTKFVPSFCRTATPGFKYIFYIVYDYDDPHLGNTSFNGARDFQEIFNKTIQKHCSPFLQRYTSLEPIMCQYSGKPAWAQNEAIMAAYKDGVDFFYRVNDDTILISPNWAQAFIKKLSGFHPSFVGLVGPRHSGGNGKILTYEFVHRIHIDIFGFYYPRTLENMFGDSWITHTYQPNHMKKLRDIKVKHLTKNGSRYTHSKKRKGYTRMKIEVQTANKTLANWLRQHPKGVYGTKNARRLAEIYKQLVSDGYF